MFLFGKELKLGNQAWNIIIHEHNRKCMIFMLDVSLLHMEFGTLEGKSCVYFKEKAYAYIV